MGCISGLDSGAEQNWQRTLAGVCAVRPIKRKVWKDEPKFAIQGMAAWIDDETVAAAMPNRKLKFLGNLDPFSRFALIAADEAVAQSGLELDETSKENVAVILGCGSNGNAVLDRSYERLYARRTPRTNPQTIPSSMMSAPASHIAMMLGLHGPTFVMSSACASSAHALGEAMHMIRAGRVDAAIAGGTEACISLGSWFAWKSLGVLAPDTCRPFSVDRKGMVLGEGAAVFVLESEEHARSRGATILAELAGYGATSDASQMTAPNQQMIERAISMAMADAKVQTSQEILISAHGTGTALNDKCEAAAIRSVFGPQIDQASVIATKSAHGHLIGASGALQFLLGIKALSAGVAPPVLNHLGADPECELPLALEAKPISAELLMCNSFAFGGLNAVIVARHPAA